METPREIEQSSWYLWDNSKHWNTWITGVAEGEKRKSGLGKKIFEEITAKNLTKLVKYIYHNNPQ